ncbi:MAG: hypothetical protein JNM13_03870 [Hyphomicrobiaceae bacterium]|nr:hypothetical protein [Hyphomicrobiaceae bacterium]
MPPLWTLAAAGAIFVVGMRLLNRSGRRIGRDLDRVDPTRVAPQADEAPSATLEPGPDGIYRPRRNS